MAAGGGSIRPVKTCTAVPGCDRPAAYTGLCATHYVQRRRGRPFTPIRPVSKQRGRLLHVTISKETRAALGEHPLTQARLVLEAWAKRQLAKK